MNRLLLAAVALAWSRPDTAHAICVPPPCANICEPLPPVAYYRSEVFDSTFVRLTERVGGDVTIQPPIGRYVPADSIRQSPGTPLLVAVSGRDTFQVERIVDSRITLGLVCGVTVEDYVTIATSPTCVSDARTRNLLGSNRCDDTIGSNDSCATSSDPPPFALIPLALLVRRRATRGAGARRSASRTTRP